VHRAILSVLFVSAALGGCRTTVEEAPPGLDQARPIVLEVQHMWRVLEGERVAGIVVRFGSPAAAADVTRHYYSVRNELQQELGTIDGHGRAWRFEPHQEHPRYVGVGPVLDGARAILGLGEETVLAEVVLERASN
jgi:hypothetical protein